MSNNKFDSFICKNTEHFKAFRRCLHMYPELGFEEHETSHRVVQELDRLGIEYTTGIARTGIVATIRGNRRDSGRRVGLRADMDALPMQEMSGLPHASRNPGKMHACGHDGHTTILLGVAAWLSENRDFSGTIHLIFQPAEEGVGGAMGMIDDGLFDSFPVDEIFALHNWPALPTGMVGVRPGPIMAATDKIRIAVRGKGGHGGVNPHRAIDPVLMSGALLQALHTVVSRDVDPLESGVISLCGIEGGSLDGFAIIPDEVKISGTVRSLEEHVRSSIESSMLRICRGIGQTFGGEVSLDYERLFPVTRNAKDSAELVASSVVALWGHDRLAEEVAPSMGAEDFSFMLDRCPGAYFFLGSGKDEGSFPLHSAYYDFNDEIIPLGIELMVKIALDSLDDKA